MKRVKQWVCPIILLSFLGMMALLLLFSPKKTYSEREKRYLMEVPPLTAQGFLDGSAQKGMEDWSADQFPFRNFFVGLNAYWTLLEGRNAQQDVLYAKDQYLIARPASQNLTQYEKTLARFEKFSSSLDIPAYFLMIPSNGALKSDLLPSDCPPFPDDLMFNLASEKLEAVELFDFRLPLKRANEERSVCYRTDHHLTSFGCYTLYQAFCQEKGWEAVPESRYHISQSTGFYGTAWSGSGYWLIPPDTLEVWNPQNPVTVTIQDGGANPIYSDSMFFTSHLQEKDQYSVFLDGNHTEVRLENPNAPDRTLVVVKDSYGHCLAPFLTSHYRSIILLDLRFYRGNVTKFLDREQADEVLFVYGTSTLLTDSNSAWLF